jgi:hypothetical protein
MRAKVIALATADHDLGLVSAKTAKAEAQSIANEESRTVALRDPVSDAVIDTVKPQKAAKPKSKAARLDAKIDTATAKHNASKAKAAQQPKQTVWSAEGELRLVAQRSRRRKPPRNLPSPRRPPSLRRPPLRSPRRRRATAPITRASCPARCRTSTSLPPTACGLPTTTLKRAAPPAAQTHEGQ